MVHPFRRSVNGPGGTGPDERERPLRLPDARASRYGLRGRCRSVFLLLLAIHIGFNDYVGIALTDMSATTDKPEISAVITCYFEEETIERFHEKLSAALKSLGRPYEIIFVNDGSTDDTFEKLRGLFSKDERVRLIIDLFKNSGQRAAMTAGLKEAHGDVLLFIDSDLQLDPSELPSLMDEYAKGIDVVSGYRRERKDSLTRVIPSKLANIIMRKVSDTRLRDFGCTFKLYNAKLLRGFDLGPFNVVNPPLVIAQAERVVEVPVSHYPRQHGKSGWTFRKLWAFNMDNVMNLSERPFQIIGLLCFLTACLVVLRIVVALIFPYNIMAEVTNGLLLNAVLISLLLILSILCIIGEYTIRNFIASERIPRYIVQEKLER